MLLALGGAVIGAWIALLFAVWSIDAKANRWRLPLDRFVDRAFCYIVAQAAFGWALAYGGAGLLAGISTYHACTRHADVAGGLAAALTSVGVARLVVPWANKKRTQETEARAAANEPPDDARRAVLHITVLRLVGHFRGCTMRAKDAVLDDPHLTRAVRILFEAMKCRIVAEKLEAVNASEKAKARGLIYLGGPERQVSFLMEYFEYRGCIEQLEALAAVLRDAARLARVGPLLTHHIEQVSSTAQEHRRQYGDRYHAHTRSMAQTDVDLARLVELLGTKKVTRMLGASGMG